MEECNERLLIIQTLKCYKVHYIKKRNNDLHINCCRLFDEPLNFMKRN